MDSTMFTELFGGENIELKDVDFIPDLDLSKLQGARDLAAR